MNIIELALSSQKDEKTDTHDEYVNRTITRQEAIVKAKQNRLNYAILALEEHDKKYQKIKENKKKSVEKQQQALNNAVEKLNSIKAKK